MTNIAPVGYQNRVMFRNNVPQQPKKTLAERIDANNEKVLKYPPLVIGAMNAFCWSTVGFGLDKMFSKLFNMKSNTKTSLIINGAIGLLMGGYAYRQASKLQNQKTVENPIVKGSK